SFQKSAPIPPKKVNLEFHHQNKWFLLSPALHLFEVLILDRAQQLALLFSSKKLKSESRSNGRLVYKMEYVYICQNLYYLLHHFLKYSPYFKGDCDIKKLKTS